jgi:putative ABC transport system permease protein
MFNPRWKKVLTDFWGHKLRSFLVIASITIGLFAIGLIVSMDIIITEDMKAGYMVVNPANILILTTPFDEDLVNAIGNLDGVAQAEGVRTMTLRYQKPNGEWAPIDIKAIPHNENMDINRVQVEDGDWPPQDRQIAIEGNKFGEDLNTSVGDSIKVELPSGLVRDIQVTSVVHDQTVGSSGAGGFFLAPVQGYIIQDTLDWLESPSTLNTLYVTVQGDRNDKAHIQAIANSVIKRVEDSGRVVVTSQVRQANNHPNRVYVEAIVAVLVVLGFLVMFLSAFLITNTLAALLNQQVNHIGVMKTIGASRGQIIGIYMALIFVYGLTSFVIALPLSAWAAYALMDYFAKAINITLQGFRVEPAVFWIEIAVAMLIPQLAGIVPILNGTRISVVEALSGLSQTNAQNKKTWFDRRLESIRGLSRPTILSLRNTFRRKGRLFLTLFTLTLGGAIFIGTFNVQSSLTNYIDRIGHYFLADVTFTLSESARISEINELIGSIPGVNNVEGWAASGGVLQKPDGTAGESVTLLAPPSDSTLVDPVVLEGRWIQPGDDNVVVVNERFREAYPNLKVGDRLKIKIAGKDEIVNVIGFFQLTGKTGGYLAYTTYEYLSDVIHQNNRANSFRVVSDNPNMNIDQQKALGAAIESKLKEKGYRVSELEAGKSLTATTADGLNILTGFLLMMAVLIAIVGSIGLTGTMSLNVLERTREIGILRAIGASDKAVMRLVMIEGLLIGMMSWIFGVILSFPIGNLMANAVNLALFGAPAGVTITLMGDFLWLLVVTVLSVLASVGPARNATRLTIREVLSYE